MKFFVLFLSCALLCSNSFGQQINDKRPANHPDYNKRAQTLQKVGYIVVGTGVACFAAAFIVPRGDLQIEGRCPGPGCNRKYRNSDVKTGLFIASGVATVVSIPFFIAAKSNRNKAGTVSFKMENTYSPLYNGVAYTSFPAAAIRIGF